MGWRISSGVAAGEWVAAQLGRGFYADRAEALGLEKDGVQQAGVIYEDYNGVSVVCHIAITARLTPVFLAAIFDYPFRVCGVDKIIAPVSSGNAKARQLVEKMGFTEEARIQNARPDGDMILYTQRQRDCRYLGERYGKKFTEAATGA